MSYFLNNINSAIGDQMRFVRDYRANPDKYRVDRPPEPDPNAGLQPFFMMMMFMMMMQMMERMGLPPGGLPGFPGFPFPEWPPFPYPIDPPILPPEPPIQGNPAYQYLQDLLAGAGTGNVPQVDFNDNTSIQKRIDAILAQSKNPQVAEFATRLKNTDPDSPEAVQIKSRLDVLLKQEGLNPNQIQELFLLMGAQGLNTITRSLEQLIQNLQEPERSQIQARLNAIKTLRGELEAQWKLLHPGGTPVADLDDKVRDGLKSGKFTEAQLGQALKYLLAQAPESQLPALRQLISDLVDSGDLSAVPFLQDGYLDRLDARRRNILTQALSRAGLRRNDGTIDTRLSGFILQALERDGQENTQTFVRKLLENLQTRYGDKPNTREAQALTQLLGLANIRVVDGKLVFP